MSYKNEYIELIQNLILFLILFYNKNRIGKSALTQFKNN